MFNIGVGSLISPAVNVLRAPPDVAAELASYFALMAGQLLRLQCDPELPHLQVWKLEGAHAFRVRKGAMGLATLNHRIP